MFLQFPLVYYSRDEGGAGGSQEPAAAPPPDANEQPQTGQDAGSGANRSFERLLTRHDDDARAVAWLLFQENFGYRQELRDARQQLTDAQGRVPAEGSLVLDAEQATLWQQYQSLGAPAELRQVQRQALLRRAAEAHGYRPSALATLAGDLALDIRQEDRDGKATPVAYVLQGEDDPIPLDQYAAAHWAEFMPALKPSQGEGPRLIRQTPSGSTPSNNVVQAALQKRYPRPSQE